MVGFLPDLGHQLTLELDRLPDPGLGRLEAVGQDLLGDLGGAGLVVLHEFSVPPGLDHHDGDLGSGAPRTGPARPPRARSTSRRPPGRWGGGSTSPRCDQATRTAPMGPSKGMPDSMSAAEAPLMASTSWGFTRSAPKIGPDHVDLVAEPLGERRPQRPVDQAAGQDGLVGGAAFTPEERAGDLAGGVHPLLDVHGQGEEVGPLADASRRGGGRRAPWCRRCARATAPSAWPASLPASNESVRSVPLIGADTVMASAMCLLMFVEDTAPGQFPVVDHLPHVAACRPTRST